MPFSQFAWREKHARGTLSVLVSCIVHTALFIFLALCYVATRQEPSSLVLQAALEGAEEVSLDFSELESLEPPSKADLPSAATSASTDFDLNVSADLASTRSSVDATLTAALSSINKRSSSGSVSGGGGGAGEALSKLGANFFGSYAVGEKFVFVLDSSKSMSGDRWTYACQELLDSIQRLQPNQKFFVICFDDKTTPMFNTPTTRMKFYTSDVEVRVRLKRWLSTRRLGPGTFPAQAMTLALQMHPDAIFLLSDGELRDNTMFVLRNINGFSTERRQVPIHTIHLMSEEGRQTLQIIATENSGTFTPVRGGGS